MRRTLILVNLLLIALVALSAWMLRRRNQEALAHEALVLTHYPKIVAAAPPAPAKMVAPAAPQNYLNDAVQKFLFVKDRNPDVIEKPTAPPPPPPMPPLPAAYGLLTFGDSPMLILTEKPGAAQRAYHKGDQVGEFKLLDFDPKHVTLEWNGQKIDKSMTELAANQANTASAADAPAPAQVSSAVQAQLDYSRPDPSKNGPGASLGSGVRACQAGDSTAAGTVVDGYKKVVVQTPFGPTCRWVQ